MNLAYFIKNVFHRKPSENKIVSMRKRLNRDLESDITAILDDIKQNDDNGGKAYVWDVKYKISRTKTNADVELVFCVADKKGIVVNEQGEPEKKIAKLVVCSEGKVTIDEKEVVRCVYKILKPERPTSNKAYLEVNHLTDCENLFNSYVNLGRLKNLIENNGVDEMSFTI